MNDNERKLSLETDEDKITGTVAFELVIEMWGKRIKKRARVVFEAPAVDIPYDGTNPLAGVSSYSIEVYGRQYDDGKKRYVTRWVQMGDFTSEAILPEAVSMAIWDAIDEKAEVERERRAKRSKKL